MLKVSQISAKLADEPKTILDDVSLEINPGEVHILQGRNGSGKSTLAAVLAGDPKFEVTSGEASINESDLLEMEPHERSLAGIFLAYQYPLEIPGVNLRNFLRLAYNARQEKDLPVFKFNKLLKQRAEMIGYPAELLDRNLNEGFSGGEKKKTEILQMAVLEPKFVILDETDSGLDKIAIKEVFEGIQKLREQVLPELGILLITHYEMVLEFIQPDFVHSMESGKVVNSQPWTL